MEIPLLKKFYRTVVNLILLYKCFLQLKKVNIELFPKLIAIFRIILEI